MLVSYIGSTRSFYGPARRLRGSIVHYCDMHPTECISQSYGSNGTRSSFLVGGYDPLQLSARSVFCFQPIGDLMTRKGLFDSLLQGCIPVLFDVLTASVMYTWHWEESFWKEISVEMQFHPVAWRNVDPVEYLRTMYANDTATVRRKQRLIRERVFELQYSLDGRYEYDKDVYAAALARSSDPATASPLIRASSSFDLLYPQAPLTSSHLRSEKGTWSCANCSSVPGAMSWKCSGCVLTSPTAEAAGTTKAAEATKTAKVAIPMSSPYSLRRIIIPATEAAMLQRKTSSSVKTATAAATARVLTELSHTLSPPPNMTLYSISALQVAPNWPRYSDGSPMRDAFDICIDLALGWHSGAEPDIRNATVPECWDGWLDKAANKCRPGEDPSSPKKGVKPK